MRRTPLLRLVDPETGEIHDEGCPNCAQAERTLVQYEKDLRVAKAKITSLERDIERDARRDPFWDEGEGVWTWWALACNHEGCRFEAEEFYAVKPHLKRYGVVGCLKAIAGAAYEPTTTFLKNGREKRFDSFDLIFRSKEKVQSFQERAPGRDEEWRRWLVTRIESSLQLTF